MMEVDGYAELHITRHLLPLEREYLTAEWIGRPSDLVVISRWYWQELEDAGIIDAYGLKIIEDDIARGAYICARATGPWRQFYAAHVLRSRVRRWLRPIKYRLILTAMVWGLAYTPVGCEPSWRDIGQRHWP